MRLETVFRISVYATLSLATHCLAFTEEAYLPGVVYFLVFFHVLLLASFVTEGRWELTLRASNVLGVLIAAGSGLWIAISLIAPTNPWIDSAPYPVAVLPLGGPVLMLVLLAKLFRPKQIVDYWWLHLIGLMEVALGCVLANELDFSFWLFAYLACALWSLALFQVYRQQVMALSGHGRWWGLALTVRRTLLIGGLALALFLLTPRFSGRPWSLLNPPRSQAQMETGYSPNIDLTHTGEVNVSEEEVFRVNVKRPDGKPKDDLDPQQRWRGNTLDSYDGGRWRGRRRTFWIEPRPPGPRIPLAAGDQLPNLGPPAYLLTFQVEIWRAGGLFLAEPVVPTPDGKPPVQSLEQNLHRSWAPYFRERDACLEMPPGPFPQRYRYQQVVLDPNNQPTYAEELVTPRYMPLLLRQPVAGIARWTEELLPRLIDRRQLTAEDLAAAPDPLLGNDLYLRPEHRAKVAKALANYFAFSGDFTYQLEMQRTDRALDPIEDFLRNTKQGFCEHYATALALVLRSVGIPARVVVGYRGAEPATDTSETAGVYVLRQSHAHSWVEALISRTGVDGRPEYYWLTLDPTPAADAGAKAKFSWAKWWRRSHQKAQEYWKSLILDYNVDRQQDTLWTLGDYLGIHKARDLLGALGSWLRDEVWVRWFLARRWPWLALPPLVGVGWWAIRRQRRPRQPAPASPSEGDIGFYRHWLAVVTRHCRLERSPAQTPWEFGDAVRQTLQRLPGSAAVTEVSRRVVALYYRVRFGGQSLTPAESGAVERQVTEFESVVANQSRP
jgi:transglutaminase-like putative cysteine protease